MNNEVNEVSNDLIIIFFKSNIVIIFISYIYIIQLQFYFVCNYFILYVILFLVNNFDILIFDGLFIINNLLFINLILI